jgi:hypothetical protein
MTTYDLLMLVVLAVWWLWYCKKYNKKAVLLYYLGGVFVADLLCGLLILIFYKLNPAIIHAPALLMPIGGVAGLLYGAWKRQLAKPPFISEQDQPKKHAKSG